MKKIMKIGLASTLGLALAIPACAQNGTQNKTVTTGQEPILVGTLGTNGTTTASVATIVALSAAEAVTSTGHTK